jgi:hypothetical protein
LRSFLARARAHARAAPPPTARTARAQEYVFKAQAPPPGGEPGARPVTFARARVDLARYALLRNAAAAAAGAAGAAAGTAATDVDVPMQLVHAATAAAAPPVLRVSVAAAWLKRVAAPSGADDDAASDVSGLSARASTSCARCTRARTRVACGN